MQSPHEPNRLTPHPDIAPRLSVDPAGYHLVGYDDPEPLSWGERAAITALIVVGVVGIAGMAAGLLKVAGVLK